MKYWIVKNDSEKIEEITDFSYGGRNQLIEFICKLNKGRKIQKRENQVYIDGKLSYYGGFAYVHHKDNNLLNCDLYKLMTDSEIKAATNKR